MKKFFTIVNRQDFNSLYRFGQIQIIANRLIEISENVDLETKLFESFKTLPFFEYDEDYILLEVSSNKDIYNTLYEIFKDGRKFPSGYFQPETQKFIPYLGLPIAIFIEEVEGVFLLTSQAQKSLQIKLDTRLMLKTLPFPDLSNKIQNFIIKQESQRGTFVFWQLCKIENEYSEIIDFALIEKAMQYRILGKKSHEIQEDFYTHLLTYERYEFYPKSQIGFLYDVGDIFAYTQGVKSFKTSGFYKFLESNNQQLNNTNLIQIFEFLDNSNEIVGFKSKLTIEGLRLYVVASIFLKFKEEIRDKDSLKQTTVGKQILEFRENKQYINELNYAIFLLGGFFGYKKFYDDYYDLIGLKIFKQQEMKQKQPNQRKIK